MTDARGYINVFALRGAVSHLESLRPANDPDMCLTSNCRSRHQKQLRAYLNAQKVFMRTWGQALLSAIDQGDEVAEVIWRHCEITPVIERNTLASTCDPDPAQRSEAHMRLQAIGFEAAIDDSPGLWEPDSRKRDSAERTRILTRMRVGVFGGDRSSGVHPGGNGADSPEFLDERRRAAAILAAKTLVRRTFSHTDANGEFKYLRLNRKAAGLTQLDLGNTDFQPELIYLSYRDPIETYLVGGPQDTLYLRTLLDVLRSSEQRIDYWLQRDSRWSIFLLHRRGLNEWIPEGLNSPFGRLARKWQGNWVLDQQFINFVPMPLSRVEQAWISTHKGRSVIRFEDTDDGEACELRYSGASSMLTDPKSPVIHSALGYLSHVGRISADAPGPIDALAPMEQRKTYRQVTVLCPSREWPDNRNRNSIFLAGNILVEIRSSGSNRDLIINHWRRASSKTTRAESPPPSDFELKPLLNQLAQQLSEAEAIDTQKAGHDLRQQSILKQVKSANTQELIASLAELRNEKLYYNPKHFPANLAKLIATPGVAKEICATYLQHPSDEIFRFNLMIVLAQQIKQNMLTPLEIQRVTNCMRVALDDSHPWVVTEVLNVFGNVANELDHPKLKQLSSSPDEWVRLEASNAMNRLEGRRTRSPSRLFQNSENGSTDLLPRRPDKE